MSVTVRPLEASDQADWRRLWTAYLTFYETTVPEEVYESTWRRLFSQGEFEPKGFIAVLEGKAVGLTHYLYHRSTSLIAPVCYLQDLFTQDGLRGKGVGRRLIEAVYAQAQQAGAARVYWMTHETNATAMKLYDTIAEKSGFLQYRKSLP